MRKATFNDNILRLLRAEIQYEVDHSPPRNWTMNSKMHFMSSRSFWWQQAVDSGILTENSILS
ncbi:hypothetical protein K2173_009619 [Erythroxylum novogranatense]|uniref:Uncharacterized protein n=1 Tax=Erythroxylum novogranatense TaxID=1862640 RepID=A0AAV8U778_9ROSI|nr:hypothetical protein K2173_009619 [Erythroxylum novogranatense]